MLNEAEYPHQIERLQVVAVAPAHNLGSGVIPRKPVRVQQHPRRMPYKLLEVFNVPAMCTVQMKVWYCTVTVLAMTCLLA